MARGKKYLKHVENRLRHARSGRDLRHLRDPVAIRLEVEERTRVKLTLDAAAIIADPPVLQLGGERTPSSSAPPPLRRKKKRRPPALPGGSA